jgi:hypothetical protein
MLTDWYKTERPGTYVAVPAGTPLTQVRLPDDVQAPLDLAKAVPMARGVESAEMAWQFNLLGIDDCLRHAGVCVLRTEVAAAPQPATRWSDFCISPPQ